MRSTSFAWLLVALIVTPAQAADPPLALGDLEAYRRALLDRDTSPAPAVTFSDLFRHPEAWAGRRVRVEGKVARLFRQPAAGEFPPLAEAWVVNPSGDPICLVFPTRMGKDATASGADVTFTGTFLRRVEYKADVPRLVPLIVGPSSGLAVAGPVAKPVPALSTPATDWTIGGVAGVAVCLILARRHLSRPPSRPPVHDPPPTFQDLEPPFSENGSTR